MTLDSLRIAVNENQHRIRASVVIVAILLCLFFLILTLKTLLFPSPLIHAEISLANASVSNARWNWYVAPSAPVVAEKEVDDDLELANINAELLGVVIAGDQSVATLSVSRKPARAYQIGDELERNVTLQDIEPNRVIISQRGARRQILMKDISGNRNNKEDDENQLIRVTRSSAPSGGGSFTLPGVGSTTPIQVPGVGMGLRLGDVSSEILDLADFQNGDVILSISGTEMSDLFSNPLLWQQFRQNTSLPMTVLRDGEREELTVNAASLFEKILPQLGAGLIQ